MTVRFVRMRRDERGSSLVIALVFLMLFSLVLSATLGAADGGLRLSNASKEAPRQLYGADGAIEQAIQQMRFDRDKGLDPEKTPCDIVTTINNTAFNVNCEPQPRSGQSQIDGGGPTLGIITLSNGFSGEIGYRQLGNSVVRLDGGLYARTPVSFVNGNICTASNEQNCQQLNLCPDNTKVVEDVTVDSSDPFVIRSDAAGFIHVQPDPALPPTATDKGVPIYGDGIRPDTVIADVLSSTRVRLSRATTEAAEPRDVTFRQDYPLSQMHCHPTDPSNGLITALDNPPDVFNTVQSCDKRRIVAGQFNCDPGNPLLSGNDPNYAPRQLSGFTERTAPPCGTAPIVELLPGKYTDVDALNALTTGCDKLIWFRPPDRDPDSDADTDDDDAYYFDFSGEASGNRVWRIGGSNLKNLVVVGGDKTWDARGPFRGSVQNGSTRVATPSATFVDPDDEGKFIQSGYSLPFGTRIIDVIDSTHATISAPATNAISQGQFTISDSASLCDTRQTRLPAPNNREGVQFIFGGPSRINAVDGKTELCAGVMPMVPADEDGDGDFDEDDDGDIDDYDVDGDGDGDADDDKLETQRQVVMYGAKALQGSLVAQNGCTTATPYPPASGNSACATLATSGPKVTFIGHGAFYAPGGVIDLSLQTVGYQVVSGGIIARVVELGVSPSADFTDPLIYAPEFGSVIGAPRQVLLTACTGGPCPDDDNPDNPGTPRLRAMVKICDTTPCEGQKIKIGYRVEIQSWVVLR